MFNTYPASPPPDDAMLNMNSGAALVTAALDYPHHAPTLSKFVAHCRGLALGYVYRKTSRERLSHFGLTAEDLAMDSVAELFERTEDGQLTHLQQRMEAADDVLKTPKETERWLHRLVAGSVDDRLFQMYQEHDPGLGRLIRNLKRAARSVDTCQLKRVEGRLCLTSAARALEFGLPLLSPERLEEGLRHYLGGDLNATRAVEALVALLNEHRGCRNGYPVSSFAVALRAMAVRLHLPFAEDGPFAEVDDLAPGALSEEMQTLVGRRLLEALTVTRGASYAGYVNTGKVPAAHFEAYFRAIRDVLIAEFLELEEDARPLWAFLKEHLHDEPLTPARYRAAHRNTFEYLLGLARHALVACLREELGNGVLVPAGEA